LESDRAEANDMAAAHPEIVERLEAGFVSTRVNEPDFPSPLYDKKAD